MSEFTQKSERLASAIYLVTSFFNDQEPAKWRLRTLSADLVSNRVQDKLSIINEMVSLFSIAKNANLISGQNHDILSGELNKLKGELERPLEGLFLPDVTPTERLQQPQRHEYIKDKIIEEKSTEKPKLKEFGAVSVKKNRRQSAIIAILKRKKDATIKDIAPAITGCSEKTIQRELSAMVQAGLLKKEGEKRWSRYYLAQ